MCQTVWIQSRTDRMSVLIWVQTVCKGYQLTTKVTASKERGKTWIKWRDFQQCGILISVDSEEPVQPPFKLRDFK